MSHPMLTTVAREEYQRLTHFGTAGAASDLPGDTAQRWQDEHPGWAGRYWTLTPDDTGVLHLGPANLSRAQRANTSSAAAAEPVAA